MRLHQRKRVVDEGAGVLECRDLTPFQRHVERIVKYDLLLHSK